MELFKAIQFDDDHKKMFEEFRGDYEKIARLLEKTLPKCRERERSFERLIESFQWVGRAIRTSQIRCHAQKKKEKAVEPAKESSPVEPVAEVAPKAPKRVLILKKIKP